ncbi:ral guanine nucleotide dissociation stimulator-like 1 isoform X2 [Halyomorpha halys]|uniref:ral guanine nucleotide dissociation stimulator-like 1 isoform X2 n=1 Tax=Halyomorpha halys TaxID=286706 RepID=UPI0006D50FCB|nr:ral guanine nucleotide dissociation stimulator isoform X2 [Halyomorpha halys]
MNLDVDNLQPIWKLWGEERIDGAIYTVYLKKVRYHRPTHSVQSEDNGERISHLEWETVRVRLLKAGTLERLVEALATDEGELESTYVNIFLATYRTFASPHEVLTLLLDRYDLLANNELDLPPQVAEQHRKTLCGALHVWLESYPEDWSQPPLHPMLRQLLLFTQQHLPNSELHIKVQHRLQSLQSHSKSCDVYSLYNGSSLCLHTTSTQPPYMFPDIPHLHFAEQLTKIDMELFKKVVVHQCLGGVWSRREKKRAEEAATVLATVTQFNAVSLRVISTVLLHTSSPRSVIIAAWIDIAQELRVLKNFSSLKAIISGLQSNPVYRLHKTWSLLPKDKVELFEELARIFSEENNQWAQRELLMREGTARFAVTVGQNDKHLQKIIQRQLNNSGTISYGTIPYLGTFLTDLTMIDAAIPDNLPNGYINFDKRRKEFEVLAQIKLLQGAANAYTIMEDPSFERWFDSVLTLDDKEAYQLSCQIEPPPANTPVNLKIRYNHLERVFNYIIRIPRVFNKLQWLKQVILTNRAPSLLQEGSIKWNHHYGHRKNDSVASTSSSSSSQFYCDIDHASTSIDTKDSVSQTSSSSNGSIDTTPMSPSLNVSQGPTDFYIIKVTYQTDNVETDGIVLYKSIMLSNNERTPQVIRNAMMKLGLEGNPEAYTIAQILPNKGKVTEMVLPPNANVYYAVNTDYNLNFILRPKDQPSPSGHKKSKPLCT